MSDQSKAMAAESPAAQTTTASTARARKVLLQDIRVKWGKFSGQQLNDLEANDDLVTRLVARYGLTSEAGQRDAAAVRNGCGI